VAGDDRVSCSFGLRLWMGWSAFVAIGAAVATALVVAIVKPRRLRGGRSHGGIAVSQVRTLTTALPSAGRRAIWFIVSECVTGPPRIRLKASVKSFGFFLSRFSRAA
jgi:hypothetical protein